MMNLLALGTELPLQMTVDGQPALNCPVHGTLALVAALLDLTLEVLPCGCPRADIADYWAEQSPMLREWLAEPADLGVLSELPEIGGDVDELARSEQALYNSKAPPSGGEDGASTAGSGKEQSQNSETLPARQAPRTLAYALAYARRGMRVFPCHEIEADHECSCGKLSCASAGKHPRLKDWQILATCDETQIREWWKNAPRSNIGLACGQSSNITVLDVDGDLGRATLRELELEHGELPQTPIALTGSGGCHYYFAYQQGPNNAVRFAPGLDVRTEGGLVVGVGSRNGRGPYLWETAFQLGLDGLQPARMPTWLIDVIKKGQGSGNHKNGFTPTEDDIREGEGRNSYLYRMGRSLKAKGVPNVAIKGALGAINQEQCKPPVDADELGQIVYNVLNQKDSADFLNKEQEEPEEKLKPLRLGQLYRLVDEWQQQPWVWQGILPRASLSIIVGKSETGKSTLIYSLIYSVVRGLDFFGRKCEGGRVLYLAGDPTSEIVAGMVFRELGLREDEEVIVLPDAIVGNPTGIKQLREIVNEFRPALVIGDTMATVISIDADKYAQSYQAQQPLVKIAREYKPNFLMSHHSQKSAIDSYSVIDAALGTVGIAAVASTRMGTKKHTRRGEEFYTWEMSSCRIGQPVKGEWIVHRYASGLCELEGLWNAKTMKMDKDQILDRLRRYPEGMNKRTLWQELKVRPKWTVFNDAIDELLASQQIEVCEVTGRGGTATRFRLRQNGQNPGDL